MNEPTLLVVGDRRKRGRPTVKERRSSISTWVPVSLHDQVVRAAKERDMSISKLVEYALSVTLKHKP